MAKKSRIVGATKEYTRKHFFSSARVKAIVGNILEVTPQPLTK